MYQSPLTAAVGPTKQNFEADVAAVQALLNKHIHVTQLTVPVDGAFGAETLRAIRLFQKYVLGMPMPDGVVPVHGITLTKLHQSSVAAVAPLGAVDAPGKPAQSALLQGNFDAAGTALQCEAATIQAINSLETPRGAFDKEGRPTILFERHYFSRLTKHVYDKTHPDISNKKSGGYGLFSAQYPKLARAALLDRNAALQSASWGAFQIMGAHYKLVGYPSVEDFVSAMRNTIAAHLNAFVKFVNSDPKLLRAFQQKDWAAIAFHFNGAGYAENSYDTKLAAAYAKFKK